MPFIPVPNVARVSVRARLFGQDVVNVLHVAAPGPISLAGLDLIFTVVRNAYAAGVQPNLSQDLEYVDVTVRDLTAEPGPQIVNDWGVTGTGGVASASMSSNVAFCITHRTALIGRSYRGRTYLAGLAEVDVATNLYDPTRADDLADAFNTMRTNLAGSGFTLAVASLFTGGDPRVTGIATPITISLARDTRVDTQRRRLD